MVFYGIRKPLLTNTQVNSNRVFNTKQRKLMFPKIFRKRLGYKSYTFIAPTGWDFIIIGDNTSLMKSAYIYSDTYYFSLSLPQSKYPPHVDANMKSISINLPYMSSFTPLYWRTFQRVFDAFNRPFFIKLRFKGKGYYIFKNKRQTITPQFGHSHRLYVYAYFVSVIFLSKTRILVFGLLHTDVIKASRSIKYMRPINIFTGRGVRFSKQVIYKKVGKVSSYR
jgi:hypothetical protein